MTQRPSDASRGADPGMTVLLEVVRGNRVESVHRGRLVLLDASGAIEVSDGPVAEPVLPRSSLKPLQAVAMVEHGYPGRDDLLALASASHAGEDVHLDGARLILAAAGLNESTWATRRTCRRARRAAAWARRRHPPAPIATTAPASTPRCSRPASRTAGRPTSTGIRTTRCRSRSAAAVTALTGAERCRRHGRRVRRARVRDRPRRAWPARSPGSRRRSPARRSAWSRRDPRTPAADRRHRPRGHRVRRRRAGIGREGGRRGRLGRCAAGRPGVRGEVRRRVGARAGHPARRRPHPLGGRRCRRVQRWSAAPVLGGGAPVGEIRWSPASAPCSRPVSEYGRKGAGRSRPRPAPSGGRSLGSPALRRCWTT